MGTGAGDDEVEDKATEDDGDVSMNEAEDLVKDAKGDVKEMKDTPCNEEKKRTPFKEEKQKTPAKDDKENTPSKENEKKDNKEKTPDKEDKKSNFLVQTNIVNFSYVPMLTCLISIS